MKIEKISDNQIRCTLTKQDLEERRIRVNELLYGSEKAKQLFRDMLQMAAVECGFDGEDTPIMVEAIPASMDVLVLVITKIENPEELDTRFSHFTPSGDEMEPEDEEEQELFGNNSLKEDIELFGGHTDKVNSTQCDVPSSEELDSVNKVIDSAFKEVIQRMKKVADEKKADAGSVKKQVNSNRGEAQYRTFRFDRLEDVVAYSKAICREYRGYSNLYKDADAKKYYLVLFLKSNAVSNYIQACNVAGEYGTAVNSRGLVFYNEHYKLLAKNDAVMQVALTM